MEKQTTKKPQKQKNKFFLKKEPLFSKKK